MKKYTKEIEEYIKNNCKGKSAKGLAKELCEKFNVNFTANGIRSFMCEHKLRLTSHMIHKPERTYKQRNVGDLREKKGLLQIKIAEPNVWKQYQVYLWEQAHNKKVKKGEVVIFLDGNKRNFDVSNLYKIPRSVLGIRAFNFSNIKGIVGYQLAEIKNLISKKKKELKNETN